MKGYLIDNKNINIGSFNNDRYSIIKIIFIRWSWKLNNEANIVLSDEIEAQ
jgi:hypothetical protein